jgi:uncharacterized membrane protein YhaH (DUF805 family)
MRVKLNRSSWWAVVNLSQLIYLFALIFEGDIKWWQTLLAVLLIALHLSVVILLCIEIDEEE